MKISEFAQRTQGLSASAFSESFPHPFLLVKMKSSGRVRSFRTVYLSEVDAGQATSTPDDEPRLFPVHKPDAGPNAVIGLGRTQTMAIVVDHHSISKMHLYFQRRVLDGVWVVVDNASKNGTELNDEPMRPEREYPIEDGDILEVGRCCEATFLSPPAAFRELTQRAK